MNALERKRELKMQLKTNIKRPLFVDIDTVFFFAGLETPHIRPVDLALMFQVLNRLCGQAKRQKKPLSVATIELQALIPFLDIRKIRRSMKLLRDYGIVKCELKKKRYNKLKLDWKRLEVLARQVR